MEVLQKGYDGFMVVKKKGRMGLWRWMFRRRVGWVYGGLGEGIRWVYGGLGEGLDGFMEV